MPTVNWVYFAILTTHMNEKTCRVFLHMLPAYNVCYDEQAAGGKRAKPPAVTPQPAKKAKVASAVTPATAPTSKPQPATAAAQPGTLSSSCTGPTAKQQGAKNHCWEKSVVSMATLCKKSHVQVDEPEILFVRSLCGWMSSVIVCRMCAPGIMHHFAFARPVCCHAQAFLWHTC